MLPWPRIWDTVEMGTPDITIFVPAVLRSAWNDLPSQPVRSIPAFSRYLRRQPLNAVGFMGVIDGEFLSLRKIYGQSVLYLACRI